MTIGKRITGGFAISIVITCALGGFAFLQTQTLDKNTHAMTEDALPGLIYGADLNAGIRYCNMLVLQHILTEEPAQIQKVDETITDVSAKNNQALANYEKQINQDEDRQNFESMTQALKTYRGNRDAVLVLSRQNKNKEAFQLYITTMEPSYEQVRQCLDKMARFNTDFGNALGQKSLAAASSAKHGILIGIAAAVAIGLGLTFFLIRSINRVLSRLADQLGQGADQVAAAAAELSSAGQSAAQGASEQAASIEETSSSIEEMASMTKKNADAAHQAAAMAADTKAGADQGNLAMGKMASAIADIQKSAGETAKIIKVIDEIAFQTNLLALNAAVEAARAGEAGKGFAVVAEEVRNLAMRSAEAAKNTSSLIEGSVQNSRNGVTIAGEVARSLTAIVGASEKVSHLVSEIAAASQEQTKGIDQINKAVGQMEQVTQQNAANAEESAAASEELSAQSEQMRSQIGELATLVKGVSAGSTKAASPAHHRPSKSVSTEHLGTRTKHGPAAKHAIPFDDDASKEDFGDFGQAA